ncbi:MAP kinase Spk1 [Ancistrocladus abbreviatus]
MIKEPYEILNALKPQAFSIFPTFWGIVRLDEVSSSSQIEVFERKHIPSLFRGSLSLSLYFSAALIPSYRTPAEFRRCQAMENFSSNGHRFQRIPHQSWAANVKLDPLLDENLEQWPHLSELVQCYTADLVKDENKYGHYESTRQISFQNQIYEGPDTDIETEMRLADARLATGEDTTVDELPTTSGRPFGVSSSADVSQLKSLKLFGSSPLPAYEPAFDWESERSMIFGQRVPETHEQHGSGLKISVKVLSLSFQAGLVEPFYGTICLYNRERRDKLSEDFIFSVLPMEMKDAKTSNEPRAIFYLDAPSASICLLIQLEKPATEEGGITPSVYSRKEPVHLSERERQKLQVWSRIMPYRESFAWAIVPLFDNSIGASSGGSASPSSPLASAVSGSSFHEEVPEPITKITLDGKLGYSSGSSVVVEISNLNKVKESYTEDSLQDPKRKIHKPVRGTLRLEIEKLHAGHLDLENISEGGSMTNDSLDASEGATDATLMKQPGNGFDGPHNSNSRQRIPDGKELPRNGLKAHESQDLHVNDFNAFDFRVTARNEPFLQLFHCLYVYPLTISLSRKRNLFIRVELRKDDADIRRQPLEAVCPREPAALPQKFSHTQVAVGARVASYHDELKVSLPPTWTSLHHLLFTFFHVDLQTKLEAPKPVVIGYAVLPLSAYAQSRSEISLPIMKELVPHYLQDAGKERLDYLEDGKNVFKLRLRLCSSLYPANERIRDFFLEYDRHSLRTSPPWGSELLEAINSLKNVDSTALLQFLHPILNMLLHLIGNGGETLQVAAFRAMVNILTRVQQESVDDAERNRFLVMYVDYAFEDFGGRQPPVYPGLSTVWGSLARSKAKGYRVGPVYDDVLAMAWFFLELIVRSMALEQSRLFYHSLPLGEDVPPMQLKEGVFRCIMQLYDCLLTEVHERCKKGLSLAKRLNSSLAFFCYDLLSVIEPRQVFELVSLYLDKFSGLCQSVLHDCKLTYLQIICDHDLFVEMPGRDPSDRNYLASMLIQELFLTLDHDDLTQRAKAARILVVLICKHEFDARYLKPEDKLYIAQLYFPLISQILDEMPVFYNLSAVEKREVLIVVLQIVRNLDDSSLIKAWQQSIARTRLFFKLLEECLVLFEHRKPADAMIIGNGSRSAVGDTPASPKYSDRLSPAINNYLSEASRQEPQRTPENGHLWQRVNSQLSSPSQPYSLREALAQAQSSRIGTSTQALRESLHPILRQKLELWEENLSAAVSLQVLEITEKFSITAATHGIATDYGKFDCVTAIFMSFFSRNQPLTFWKALFPVFNNIFNLHGATLMARENDRFLKQIAFHLLRLAVFRNDNIRRRAVVGLQILVRSSFCYFLQTSRLRVMLTITLSELMSDVQVTQMKPDGTLEESGEARRLRKSLEELADELKSPALLSECGIPEQALVAVPEKCTENQWSWSEVKCLSDSLIMALDASLEHGLLGPVMNIDRYAATESFYKLAISFAPVPDLHIMWLLHLCDAHQEMQSWAEAAQCAVAVAGVVMQALVSRNDGVWSKDQVAALRKICPMVSSEITSEASAAEVEGYGASKLTVDSAVKYLQLANKLFSQAELYHFCASILELVIPVYKSRRAYGQLAKCHTMLTNIYESILEQESSPIPFTDATYYRVGFYGDKFGKLDKKEYVYREPRDVRLGDMMEKITHVYESRLDGKMLKIIQDSGEVKADRLEPGFCYLQVTAVDPVMEDEDLGSRRERIFSLSTGSVRARVFDRFLFDTPFTKNGKTQGGLEDQWKRRTVLQTEGSFPALVNRLLVVKSESMEFSPVENAIGMIETRTAALRNELEEPRSSEGDQLPRLQSLQRILQGSVAVQVNSGVLSVCTAFLSGEPAARLRSQELQQLIAALLEFMAVCKRAIRVHFRLIGEEDQEFHTQLVNGFQSLTAELSHYIPAILSEL